MYIVDNNVVEGPEFFHCTLTISDDLVAAGVQVDLAVARVNITDNDGMQPSMVWFTALYKPLYSAVTFLAWSCAGRSCTYYHIYSWLDYCIAYVCLLPGFCVLVSASTTI